MIIAWGLAGFIFCVDFVLKYYLRHNFAFQSIPKLNEDDLLNLDKLIIES